MRCRRSRADISADAEISASRLAGDAELLHLRLQRRAFHAQAGGRTGESSDHPIGFAEDAQNVLTLGRFQVATPLGTVTVGVSNSPSRTRKAGPWDRVTDRQVRFSSPRMLPGH